MNDRYDVNEEDHMLMKMDNAVMRDQLETMAETVTAYRNEVRYLHDILRRLVGNMKGTIGEYNDRKLKVRELDDFLRNIGGLGIGPFKDDETTNRKGNPF